MPGMNTGLRSNNPTIVGAFKSELLHQGFVVLVILAFLSLVWMVVHAEQLRRGATRGQASPAVPSAVSPYPEPIARRLLRISFGLIWIFDGVLQGQSSMPLGMTTQVIQPAAAASPHWVQHVANAGATIWSYHPITTPASAVWIQVGIGLWLLVAPRGNWSRLGGAVSVGWGLLVWVFGEAFGGIFAPGLTWLFGAPGAVIFYCFAGLLIALPERSWSTPRLGRRILAAMGLFFVGMAVLQAWPGRGYWQGHLSDSAASGTLTTMVHQMAQTPQPDLLSSWVGSFAAFDAAHGWAVNLFAVISLAVIGAAFLTGRVRVVRVAVVAAVVLCLADWVLIEDFGFLGGTGTDPNSMIPMALIIIAGYLALTKVPVAAEAPDGSAPSWRERLTANPTYVVRSMAVLAAIGIVLVGAAPMAVATTNRNADPILAEATNGTPNAENIPAANFQLVDQHGHVVSLASLHGKTVALTFFDPVCVSDCPLIAQEFRNADSLLSSSIRRRVQLIAIVANPLYRAQSYTLSFDRQEGLDGLTNWHFLTGSLAQLQHAWRSYGYLVELSPGGTMVAHSDIAFVIDAEGHTRYVLGSDPGPGTAATKSSFAVTLANAIDSVAGSR